MRLNRFTRISLPVAICGLLLVRGQSAIAGTPDVKIQRDGSGTIILTFSGALELSDHATGPWVGLTTGASPLPVEPSRQMQFFRTRDDSPTSIFETNSVVAWTLTGPFQQHFELALAGTPDGIFPPRREKPNFDGRLQFAGYDLPVNLRVRGNSSLQECPFPKIKFKVSKEDRLGTPFFDAREIKIGTHCAEGGRGNVGRLRDERATYREATAYEVMRLLEFVSPRVRRARIEYRDVSGTNALDSGWQLTRSALVLEDIEVVAEHHGARALSDAEIARLENPKFDEQLVVDMELFHALLGNWDYELPLTGANVRNTEVIELPNGQLIPVAGDFDLASWVTGEVRASAPHDYHPELPELDRQALYRVSLIKDRTMVSFFKAGKDRFISRRAQIEQWVANSAIDDAGRTNAMKHIETFFGVLTTVAP